MDFTFEFIRMFTDGLYYAAPILIALLLIILSIGYFIGKLEGWTIIDALYCSLITATTVGYGDLRPSKNAAKFFTVIIAFIGIVFTGIIVAIAIHAATHAFKTTHDVTNIMEQVNK